MNVSRPSNPDPADAAGQPRVRAVEPDAGQRARLRWFLAAHLAAVTALYATAVMVGGGLASTPFPPDLAHRATPKAQATPADTTLVTSAAAAAPRPAPALPSAPDLAAPWHHGGDAVRD